MMHKILILCLLSISVSLRAQNLLQNGDFENGLSGWNLFPQNPPAVIAGLDATQAHSGQNSLALSIDYAGSSVAGAAQAIPLVAGRHYLISCWVKTDSVEGIALPYINLGNTSLQLEYGILPANGTQAWSLAQARLIAPPGVSNLTLFLFLAGTRGTVHFDDVSVMEQPLEGLHPFTVNLTAPVSSEPIHPLMGVNAGPLHPPFALDLSAPFQQTGINFVRTHDFYGPCDLHTIFPDPNKDPLDPTAYDFSQSDVVINGIVATGARVLFRLGESFEATPIHNVPPADFQKTAQVCEQIVRHYNEGWNNGFYHNIQHWEIWNEPDLSSFWSGSAEDFALFYQTVATRLKQYNPDLIVGGPALASVTNRAFLNTFLQQISTNNVPLDFFSYHAYYSANPYHFVQFDQYVSNILDSFGLGEVPHYLTEWNNYTYSANANLNLWRNDPFNAASTASTLMYLQETGVTEAFRYRADEFLFPLFDDAGNYTYPGLAFKAFGHFRQNSRRVFSSGGDSLGRAILAGTSVTTDTLVVMVSDPSSNGSGYNLNFIGTEDGSNVFYHTIYRIDSTYQYTNVGGGIWSVPEIQTYVKAPFCDLIVLVRVNIGTHSASQNSVPLNIYPQPHVRFLPR